MYVNASAIPALNASIIPDSYNKNLHAPSLENERPPVWILIYNFDLTPSNRNLTSLSALVDGFHLNDFGVSLSLSG